ncbi:response regulator transcription factor [Terrimonas sp. NA20]|uniref:Response regulator transcription factor n=1 Tax=Terrimonas ginsenosidimutans TaxID=2908004 RepID=A0ABS9KU76_9BACT|nr:response regulator transcription factor [Terrimonas ginsenosidimutans]MCG2615838.1 response regulator transcription factor [Terrimonas ginsenosidimutans]
MERISCMIIEDEPLAAEILIDYISQVPFLDLKKTCSDALYALEVLQQQRIDLLFLDIHLPRLKGLDFIRTLKHPPKVILTTAYREYALDGYELNVMDYLLKPIHFNRFLMAVNKIKEINLASPASPASAPVANERPHLLINVNKKRIRVFFDEILYIESRKEYVNIVTQSKSYLTKYQISEIEELLDRKKFIRIHRSFVVAREKLSAFSAGEVEINSQVIPIGRSYKELVLSILSQPL